MWCIQAQMLTLTFDGEDMPIWEGSKQIPTFYLDERVQGIQTDQQAIVIARQILNPGNNPDIHFNITAVKVA